MGGAILGGLRSVEVDGGIRVTNRTAAKADAITGDNVFSLATEVDADANRRAVTGARIVVLGVKPAGIVPLLREIADALEPDAAVVSVAAGVPLAAMEAVWGGALLRAMPNTPSLVGRGVTGVAAGARAGEEDLALVTRLFQTVGSVLVVEESRIDALSTISGSGPAYVFYLIEELTRTAVDAGFTPEEAALMVNDTFLGAAELLRASDVPPQELRRRVTSPNGTTERAIAVLETGNLKGLFDRATASALARAKEIAAGA